MVEGHGTRRALDGKPERGRLERRELERRKLERRKLARRTSVVIRGWSPLVVQER